MSETPRTNAILTAILETHGHVGFLNCPPTWVAWARELERELNAANDRIKRMEDRAHRASVAFFRDGSDGHVASQMLQILEEERGEP